MKKRYLLVLLGGLGLLFIHPTFSQSNISAGITIGALHPYGRVTRSFQTGLGRNTVSSIAGMGEAVLGIGLQIRIETPLSRRFKVSGNLHWISSNQPQNEGSFPVKVTNQETIITSAQYYALAGFDGIITYQLFPQLPFEIRIGSGVAVAHRLYKYRDEFTYQITGEEAQLTGEHFARESEVALGLPIVAQIRLPLNAQTTLGLHSAFRQYLNDDRQFTISFELGYNF